MYKFVKILTIKVLVTFALQWSYIYVHTIMYMYITSSMLNSCRVYINYMYMYNIYMYRKCIGYVCSQDFCNLQNTPRNP